MGEVGHVLRGLPDLGRVQRAERRFRAGLGMATPAGVAIFCAIVPLSVTRCARAPLRKLRLSKG